MIRTKANRTRFGRLLAAFLTVLMVGGILGGSITASASNWKYDFPADAATVRVTLNGQQILEGEAAILNSVTYIPLRSFCDALGVDSITWNGKTNVATVKKNGVTIDVPNHGTYITANGRYFYTGQPIRNISDRLFLPIRPLAQAFGLSVTWDPATRTAILHQTGEVLVSGSLFYNKNDCYWL
ncbi:MAG: copper amine oxidase N-terminal domain-containing protein, partial [Clostridia bacterium]|nr:copper amine oxidase N-terminal domain-containing protein [Clostridia bacterium]